MSQFLQSFAAFASFAVNFPSRPLRTSAANLSSAQTEFRHQRQMVRRQERHAAAVEQKLFERQVAIKIHEVQMHDWKHAGIGALAIEMKLDIDAFKRML